VTEKTVHRCTVFISQADNSVGELNDTEGVLMYICILPSLFFLFTREIQYD